MFCTYDKVGIYSPPVAITLNKVIQVARVKNKWKCILKDGMIHVNGKDYLFAKCTGYVTIYNVWHSRVLQSIVSEFEW